MILLGDALEVLRDLPPASAHCCVTSPPYWGLREYGVDGQIGQEATPEEYVGRLREVFAAVRRVLRPDGTLWLVLGDTYKSKQLVGIPWRVALALQADGWWLRSEIIWAKSISGPHYRGGACMPEAVWDRCTRAHDTAFLLAPSPRYYYDAEAITEPASGNTCGRGTDAHRKARTARAVSGRQNLSFSVATAGAVAARNMRSVWYIHTHKFREAHFATYPPALVERMILAGTSERGACARCGAQWRRIVDRTQQSYPLRTVGWEAGCECDGAGVEPATVLDPFAGAGTTGLVAERLGRRHIGVELNPEYREIALRRIREGTSQMTLEVQT